MPKKLFTISILIALFMSTLAIAPPTHAEKLNINGADYWTLDEVMRTGAKYTEDLKMCDGNRECESYLDTAYILAENEYSAGQAFMNNYFIITAINPTDSTIRVVFHDEANRWMMMPEDDGEKDIMKNLYIYWWDGEPQHWIHAFEGPEWSVNRQDIFVHLAEPGEEWLTPNQEIELKAPDFDFSHLKTSRIFFNVRSTKSNAEGDRDITECMNAISGLSNYECQAVFDLLGDIVYQPTEVISTSTMRVPEPSTEVISATSAETPTIIDATTASYTTVSSTGITVASTDTTIASTDTAATSPESATKITLDTTPDNTPEVPLVAGKKEDHEFPWWLVVFIFSGIFLILWWFVPIRRKKDEKNS